MSQKKTEQELPAVYLFIDTALLIHAPPLDQIRWQEVFPQHQIHLVLTDTVLKEFSTRKDKETRSRIRDRIRKREPALVAILDRLEEAPPSMALQHNVTIEHCPFTVTSQDIQKLGLDPEMKDHRLLAAAHMFAKQSGFQTFIHANDHGIRASASALKLPVKYLDQHYLAEEPSDEERENQALREELRQLKGRMPKLILKWTETPESNEFTYRISSLPPQDRYVTDALDEYVARHPEFSQASTIVKCDFRQALVGGLPKFSTESITNHLKQYRTYLNEEWKYRHERSRALKIALSLVNNGTAPATRISLTLRAKELTFLEEKALNVCPPSKPAKPGLFENRNLDAAVRVLHTTSERDLAHLNTSLLDPNSPFITFENKHEVTIHLRRPIDHEYLAHLPIFFVVFPDNVSERLYHLDYTLYCVEWPKSREDQLAIRVVSESTSKQAVRNKG